MADPNNLPPLPKDHLSNPQNWGTGGEPATEKQKAFIGTLENQHTDLVPPNGIETGSLSKGEASEVIEKLKGGQSLGGENAAEESRQADLGKEEELANAPQDSQLNEDQPVTSSNGNHLDHPENWTTGGEPATEKQKAFIASLAKQKGEAVDQMGLGGISKSGASERIDELQSK